VTNIARGEAFDSNGASYAVFSVSTTKKVRFSKGNLQYTRVGSHSVQGGGTATGTWRFAPNQWDIIGSANTNASNSSYTGYLDLFYPGTSGWNNHYPYSSTAYGGNYSGANVSSDWGVYNAISNGGNTPGIWRTLTNEEWDYLLNTRDVLNVRYKMAKIVDTYGVIIFPDRYNHPTTLSPIITTGILSLSMSQFEEMEKAGCVFLPTTGYRNGNSFVNYGPASPTYRAYYSTATQNKNIYVKAEYSGGSWYYSTTQGVTGFYSYGNPVRLVQDCENMSGGTGNDIASAPVITIVSTPCTNGTGSAVVSITTATPGATIYYTTNGTTPTTASSIYTGNIGVSSKGTVVKAIAVIGASQSEVVSETVSWYCWWEFYEW
jgi:hypothetical protein